jgi:hypothetical protein
MISVEADRCLLQQWTKLEQEGLSLKMVFTALKPIAFQKELSELHRLRKEFVEKYHNLGNATHQLFHQVRITEEGKKESSITAWKVYGLISDLDRLLDSKEEMSDL